MYQNQGEKSAAWMSLLREKMGLIMDVNYTWLVNEDVTSLKDLLNCIL